VELVGDQTGVFVSAVVRLEIQVKLLFGIYWNFDLKVTCSNVNVENNFICERQHVVHETLFLGYCLYTVRSSVLTLLMAVFQGLVSFI
jgi:hypothetical protein